MSYANLSQKHVSQKVYFMQKTNIKFRQYLFLVALYETILLSVKEICFADQSLENLH